MSFMPEDRNAELRALFFETANELLQSLNESGLELEARPADEEIIPAFAVWFTHSKAIPRRAVSPGSAK